MDRWLFAAAFVSGVVMLARAFARAFAGSDWTGKPARTRNSRDQAHPMTLKERNARRRA